MTHYYFVASEQAMFECAEPDTKHDNECHSGARIFDALADD